MHRTLLFDREFWRFYGRLVWQMLSILWAAADHYLTVVGVASFFVILLNPEIAVLAESAWSGISRWWALVPLGVLFAYGLMKANYEAFQEVEGERDLLRRGRTTREKRIALKDALGDAIEKGQELHASDPTTEDAEKWVNDTAVLIWAALGDGEVHLFANAPGVTLHSGGNESRHRGRLHRLGQLIARVDGMELRPDFDPEEWTDRQ